MSIRLLDCTLRDGGHLNNSKFGEFIIRNIIRGLERTNVDLIELGFVRRNDTGADYAAASNIMEWEKRFDIGGNTSKAEYCVMIQEDQYDILDLVPCDGKIRRIRVSFHDYDMEEGLAFCEEVIKKGYLCHVNPINIIGYSDEEILRMIKRVNEMGASVFTLVDTFGSMSKEDLLRLFMLLHHNLDDDIAIGLHFHDNLKMAFALAQTTVEIASDKREVIIDGSLLGMGRPPGNLCIELIMESLNRVSGSAYDVDAALDLIDDFIVRLREKYPWGYEVAYALSAQYKLHRTYAEYLVKKQKLRTKDIRQILEAVQNDKRSCYDEDYIEKLYQRFVLINCDDSQIYDRLKRILENKRVLLMAPGSSVGRDKAMLQQWIKKNAPFIITANFECNYAKADLIFCSNGKRLKYMESQQIEEQKLLVASHIGLASDKDYATVNTNNLAWFNGYFWDNCMLMLLNLIKRLDIKECYVAGWDGFAQDDNFVDSIMESPYGYVEENDGVIKILYTFFKDLKIHFLTRSIYQT